MESLYCAFRQNNSIYLPKQHNHVNVETSDFALNILKLEHALERTRIKLRHVIIYVQLKARVLSKIFQWRERCIRLITCKRSLQTHFETSFFQWRSIFPIEFKFDGRYANGFDLFIRASSCSGIEIIDQLFCLKKCTQFY